MAFPVQRPRRLRRSPASQTAGSRDTSFCRPTDLPAIRTRGLDRVANRIDAGPEPVALERDSGPGEGSV